VTRAFVAVRPPDSVLDAVPAIDVPSVRPTTREQWHITLQFLGNAADIDAVTDALQRLEVRAGTAQLGGAGAFPSARRATVLWLGLCEGSELLTALATAVGERLTPLGHPPETRRFHPHLTLGRCKAPTDLRRLLEELGDPPVGDVWTVAEVVVYESRLQRAGARYVPRAAITLLAGPPLA
jgi:2'-5' RNA ligase